MKKTNPALFSTAAIFAFALANGFPALAATELARINNRVITLEEFSKRYQESAKFFQLRAPSKKGVLDDLIKREIGIQEAKRLGLDKDPEIVERMNVVLYNALLEKKLSAEFEKIHISDDEAEAFYSKNPEIRTSQLFVAMKPDATAKDEKEGMERIRKMEEELRSGKGFAEVAQRLSDGPSAPTGGDMDYQTKERLDPLYYAEALKLKSVGSVSRIFRSPFGFHIVKLTGRKTWEQVDHAHVKRQVFAQRRLDIFEKYMKTLRQQAKVTVKEDLLKN